MNKPPRMSNTPVPSIHAYESREDFIARALQARDQAQATNTYLSPEEVLNRLDQSLTRAKNKPPSS
jgi:predicted transcriptional regulator